MYSFCCCSLPIWRRRPLEKTLIDLFFPALDSPQEGSGQKIWMYMRGHQFFITTKFLKHPSSCSVVKADYVSIYINKENLSRSWGEDRENPRDEPLSLDRALARSRQEVHPEGYIIYLAYFLPKPHFNEIFIRSAKHLTYLPCRQNSSSIQIFYISIPHLQTWKYTQNICR